MASKFVESTLTSFLRKATMHLTTFWSCFLFLSHMIHMHVMPGFEVVSTCENTNTRSCCVMQIFKALAGPVTQHLVRRRYNSSNVVVTKHGFRFQCAYTTKFIPGQPINALELASSHLATVNDIELKCTGKYRPYQVNSDYGRCEESKSSPQSKIDRRDDDHFISKLAELKHNDNQWFDQQSHYDSRTVWSKRIELFPHGHHNCLDF